MYMKCIPSSSCTTFCNMSTLRACLRSILLQGACAELMALCTYAACVTLTSNHHNMSLTPRICRKPSLHDQTIPLSV
jgi:hypothetical protein